jgi:hypothetical protein
VCVCAVGKQRSDHRIDSSFHRVHQGRTTRRIDTIGIGPGMEQCVDRGCIAPPRCGNEDGHAVAAPGVGRCPVGEKEPQRPWRSTEATASTMAGSSVGWTTAPARRRASSASRDAGPGFDAAPTISLRMLCRVPLAFGFAPRASTSETISPWPRTGCGPQGRPLQAAGSLERGSSIDEHLDDGPPSLRGRDHENGTPPPLLRDCVRIGVGTERQTDAVHIVGQNCRHELTVAFHAAPGHRCRLGSSLSPACHRATTNSRSDSRLR